MITNHRKDRAASLRRIIVDALHDHLGGGWPTLTSSGTSALELALTTLDLARGRAVLVPAIGCDSIAMSVWNAGFTPSFYDLDSQLRPILSDRPEAVAIVVVHHFGMAACDLASELACYRQRGWKVIADCAGAFDTRQRGRHVALIADVAILSFADGKHLECGEGGAVVSSCERDRVRVERLADIGRERDTTDRTTVGRNLIMSRPVLDELRDRLHHWPQDREARLERWRAWRAVLADTPIRVLDSAPDTEMVPQKLLADLGALSDDTQRAARDWADASSVAQRFWSQLPFEKSYNARLGARPPHALAWKDRGLILGVAPQISLEQLRREGAALRAIASVAQHSTPNWIVE